MPLILKDLTNELDTLAPVLSEEQLADVKQALGLLLVLLQQCLSQCCSSALGNDVQAHGELLPAGAYHMGVASPGDVIDVVFESPPYVPLQELSAQVAKALQQEQAGMVSLASDDGTLSAPGLKFAWRGITIKLLFAVCIPDIPRSTADGGIVKNVAGMVAHEVSQKLLSCVPDIDQFRLLLRFVRFWAKCRGIYGRTFGYFSGTAWAICCARICQQNPKAQLPQLASQFFRTLGRWEWPAPLTTLSSDGPPGNLLPGPGAAASSSSSAIQPSGSMNTSDPFQPKMPVLLPVGTSVVATTSVSETTMKILQKEFRRGMKTAKQVELFRLHWSDVYNSARFFNRHRHYLEFDFMAADEELLNTWSVWASNQLEGVVQLFESTSKELVTLRPWPEWLTFKDSKWAHARAIFCGLHLERGGKDGENENKRTSFDLREPVVKFLETMASWPGVDQYNGQFELEVRHVKLDDLEKWLDNRAKGLIAHSSPAPRQGLYLQNIEETSMDTLPAFADTDFQ
jgi:poly(A) polymerase